MDTEQLRQEGIAEKRNLNRQWKHDFRLVSAHVGYLFAGIGQIWPLIAQN